MPVQAAHSLEAALVKLGRDLERIKEAVDAFVTPQRVLRYLTAIADVPAPSTAATAMRGPVLHDLLKQDGALGDGRLRLDPNFRNTANLAILANGDSSSSPIWFFAHLDTISYLVQAFDGGRHPLVPYCYHLTEEGSRPAEAYRFDLARGRFVIAATGTIESEAGTPFFKPNKDSARLRPGDRVVPTTRCRPSGEGRWTGHFDNAGGVAALAVAAPVLAEAGVDALLAFPDEEEGPRGSGNQVMSRGSARMIGDLTPPDLAIVVDMQQAGGGAPRQADDGRGGPLLGGGAVLSEFSSLARGAVTPQPLYALARHLVDLVRPLGVSVQEAHNSYTSRSDDVSVMLKTPNILLMGFPGFDRHFDQAEPSADPSDIVQLAKALVYASFLQPVLRHLTPWGAA